MEQQVRSSTFEDDFQGGRGEQRNSVETAGEEVEDGSSHGRKGECKLLQRY